MTNTVIAANGVEVQKFRVLGSYRSGVDIVHKVQMWVGTERTEDGSGVVVDWIDNDEWRELVGLA